MGTTQLIHELFLHSASSWSPSAHLRSCSSAHFCSCSSASSPAPGYFFRSCIHEEPQCSLPQCSCSSACSPPPPVRESQGPFPLPNSSNTSGNSLSALDWERWLSVSLLP